MFRRIRSTDFTSRGLSQETRHGNGSKGQGKVRGVHPVLETLETRNLLSHATLAAASPKHVHAAAEVSKVPSYPYSGLGHIHFLQLSQVPADTGISTNGNASQTSLGNYRGLAVTRGAAFAKGERGKPELLLGRVATIPVENLKSSFGQVVDGVKTKGYNFASYAGDEILAQFPGTVVKVVDNWTPKSHDPNGNYVVIQTVEPDGLVFDVGYSHLLSNIKVKVGQYISPDFKGHLGQGGHTGVPANQTTTYSITAWTPEFGGQYLPFGYDLVVAPETIGVPPNFVDLDPNPNGSSDDPDNDADDPGGFQVAPTGP